MNYSPRFFPLLVSLDTPRQENKPSRRQTFFQALPFLAFALLMAAGRFSTASAQNAPSPDTKGSLVLFDFGDANDKQIRDAAIARFSQRYPNVKVTDQFTPITSWPDYIDKIVTQVASGKAP